MTPKDKFNQITYQILKLTSLYLLIVWLPAYGSFTQVSDFDNWYKETLRKSHLGNIKKIEPTATEKPGFLHPIKRWQYVSKIIDAQPKRGIRYPYIGLRFSPPVCEEYSQRMKAFNEMEVKLQIEEKEILEDMRSQRLLSNSNPALELQINNFNQRDIDKEKNTYNHFCKGEPLLKVEAPAYQPPIIIPLYAPYPIFIHGR